MIQQILIRFIVIFLTKSQSKFLHLLEQMDILDKVRVPNLSCMKKKKLQIARTSAGPQIKIAVRGRGRLSQIGASRNPFRSTSTTEYSAVVFVAIFAVRPKLLRLPYIVKQRVNSGVAGEHTYVKIEHKSHLTIFCLLRSRL